MIAKKKIIKNATTATFIGMILAAIGVKSMTLARLMKLVPAARARLLAAMIVRLMAPSNAAAMAIVFAAIMIRILVWNGRVFLLVPPVKLVRATAYARQAASMAVRWPDCGSVREAVIRLAAIMTRIPVWNGQPRSLVRAAWFVKAGFASRP